MKQKAIRERLAEEAEAARKKLLAEFETLKR
jgi:hypothetical protein